jgi:hypothetical protein
VRSTTASTSGARETSVPAKSAWPPASWIWRTVSSPGPARNHDSRAGLREGERHRLPNAGAAAGHQRHPSREFCHLSWPFSAL